MNQLKSKNPFNSYIKYSNLAFQILAVFIIGVFGGFKLDKLINLSFPIFTILFSLISIAIVIFISTKDFFKK